MSAMPPIATTALSHSETSRCDTAKQHNCFINSSHGHQNFRDFKDQKNGALRPWIQHITVNAAQLQLKIAFDVDFEKARQQSCTDHLLERFAVARIRHVRQKD